MAENVVARQADGWNVISLSPDVCKTPMGPATPPVPYPVTADLVDAVQTVPTVKANAAPLVVLTQSFIPKTKGDEPGTAKGISSGTVADICEPLEHSTTLKAGGFPVLRHGDVFWMNNKNTTGKIYGEAPAASVPASAANPPVVPETSEEKSFWEIQGESYITEANSRSAATHQFKDAISDFTVDHTDDGAMNSEMIAAMLHAGDIYSRVPGASDEAVQQLGGEAAEAWKTLNTDQVRGIEIAAGSVFMGYTLSKTGAQIRKKETEPSNSDANAQCTRKCSSAGEPIDMVTGDFLQHLSVLTVPGTLPLNLTRFHRSRSNAKGLFGEKWMDEWSCYLEIDKKIVRFTDHEGVTLNYTLPSDGQLVNAVNCRIGEYVLSGNIHGELSVFDRKKQHRLVFSQKKGRIRRLSAICDGYGNTANFIYKNDLLTNINHSDNFILNLSWQQEKLISIDLCMENKTQCLVTCNYDERGRLAECETFQFSHILYHWSQEGQMTSWSDIDGTQLDLFYDDCGRVIKTQTPQGYYNDHFIWDEVQRRNTYQDGEGGLTHFEYNDEGLVICQIDPLSRKTLTTWKHGNRISEIDALERITTWEYNAYGDITRISFPDGTTLHYAYDDNGNLTRFQGPGNKIWQFNYDEFGGLQCVTDPLGRQRSQCLGANGELLQQILPDGETWHYGYDPLHRLNRVTDPALGETLLEQDMLGRMLEIRDPLYQTTTCQQSTHHASPGGSVTHTNLPDGVIQQHSYSDNKLMASFTDGEGKTTRYEYGPFDLLTALVRPDGTRLECRYDRLTRLSDIINAAGEHYRLTYDKAGQLIRETDFTGRTLQYEYDAAGRRICTRYPDNHFIRWYYDDGDRVIQRQAWQTADGYDKLIATTDYRYDAEHRLISARNPDAQVEFEYDADGNITAETLNGRRTEHTHHPLNGHALSWQLDNVSMQFARGPMGRVTQWQVNDHAPLNISHDALGRETQRCSEAGFLLGQRYSPTGNITGQWAGTQDGSALPQGVSRTQEYDRAYNLTRVHDQRWGKTDYRYDSNDQVTFAEGGVRQLPKLELFAYDRNLNILHQGMTRNLPDELMQFTEQVQQTGRVTTRGDTRYRYDDCGRLVEKLGIRDGYHPQQWRYRWDSSNQLTELITPEGQRWQYRYDAFGRRISKRKLHATKGIAGYDFHWSGNQLVAETPVYADGSVAAEQTVYWLYEPGALTPAARYQHGELHYIVRDHMGTPRELLTESGKVVWAQKLSVWGKAEYYRFNGWHAANDDTAPDCPWRFAGQYADPESGLHYNRFRYYDDDSGQYISPDPIGLNGGINLYAYVKNPLTWIDPLGLAGNNILFDSDFWKAVGDSAAKTKMRVKGAPVFEIIKKVDLEGIKKGDLFHLDTLHLNEIEVYDSKGTHKAVYGLDGNKTGGAVKGRKCG
ncbi:MAG TPA: PAAR-like domain-containing protein [Scandinavium sp.]|jgi:RHS repeat-associated protein|uniref:PAAR-like domain-containing protein n=1 Tax=Scandinavium sp. TaxID=2830653 RepID=UPI002E367C4C|nr:PAAR-like domain-containing protein [Scandinavium sp.]HEX4504039.1 PAAR-like domain-containing protein [Scandinavium sp.]